MLRGITKLILVGVLVSTAFAQSFTVFNRNVQVHGFASQGFVYTGDNNWLTMNTGQGSGAFTDFGVNASTNLAEKLRRNSMTATLATLANGARKWTGH